ncbi:MAG: hypothetical protein KA401_04050 [Anaerolineae bacterium]|nr:hypothetical protein [Anaerolineae bacterium]
MGGIGGLLGLLGVLGFAGFLGGIALVVVWSSQNRPVRAFFPLIALALVVGIGFSVIGQGLIVVEPQEVAVVFNTLDGSLGEPRRAGTHIIFPVLQQSTIYPISFQEYTMSGVGNEGRVQGDDAVRVRTSDGQEVLLDITLIYRINPEQVNTVHERWQNRYEADLVRPLLRGFVRDAVSGFRAEAVYGESRAIVQEQIETDIRTRLETEGFEVTDMIIRNVAFSSEEFALSIERVQIAERQAEEAAFRVQQEEQEAERVRVRADGARDASIAEAEGEAQGIRLLAEARADALRLVSEQLLANPLLIQYEYIQNLSDNVGIIMVPSNSPFLFDLETLTQSLQSVVPPATSGTGE